VECSRSVDDDAGVADSVLVDKIDYAVLLSAADEIVHVPSPASSAVVRPSNFASTTLFSTGRDQGR